MRTPAFVALALAVGALLTISAPALAKGPLEATLDDPNQTVRAGEPTDIGFTIAAGGEGPISLEETVVFEARNAETGERFRVQAHRATGEGRYVAQVTFPSDGSWSLQASGNGPMLEMPSLQVLPAAPAVPAAPPVSLVPLLVAAAAALLVVGALIIGSRAAGHGTATPCAERKIGVTG